MRIVDIREVTLPIASSIANAYVDFSKMTLSLVAVLTDVIRDGHPVIAAGLGLGGNESYPDLFQPFGGSPTGSPSRADTSACPISPASAAAAQAGTVARLKSSGFQVWGIATIAALDGLLFGYDWVVIGGAKPFYEAHFHLIAPEVQGWA